MKKKFVFFISIVLMIVLSQVSFSQDTPSNPGNQNDGIGMPSTQIAVPVIPGNNSTSGNARAPQGSRLFANSKYLINGAEMTASGFGTGVVNSIGWRWNVPFPPAAAAPIPQNITTTGNLKVFLKDTVGTATTLTGTFIDTNNITGGYVKIIDGTITIPAGSTQIDIDVPIGGPGTAAFSPTAGNGVIVIFVYKTTSTLATPTGAPLVTCTNAGAILTYQSQTTPGAVGTASTFRPVTRFGNTPIPVCDVGAVNNFGPLGTAVPNCPTIAPMATVHNYGSATQTGIPVTYTITGPVAYTNSKTVDLLAQESKVVVFDSTFSPTPGVYSVKIYTSLACDTLRSNDTVTATFTVVNPHFGGPLMTCPYFFANSTTCSPPPPARPIFGWEDTTGSTYLVIDTTIQPPGSAYGVSFFGSRDDGHWRLAIPGTEQFRFCGVAYDSFFVGTNGLIGLTLANNTTRINSFTPTNLPLATTLQPGLFPLWYDFSYNASTVTGSRISYKTLVTPFDGLVLLITYDRAPTRLPTDATDYTSFQVILQLAPGPVVDGRIIYQYDDSRTGATFLNKYFGFNLLSHTVGIQDAIGASGIQYRRVSGVGAGSVLSSGPLFTSPVAVAFGPDQQVLPVELASFTSTVNRRDVTLNWTTATENNNSGFDIERSMVNGQWSMVGNVSGNGTSTTPHNYSYTDRSLASGKYNYRLKQIDLNGNFEYFNLGNEVGVGIPTKYDLGQNYPNPFNPTTKINYDIPFDAEVSIKLFDVSGREVVTLLNNIQTAGYYTIDFNGSNLASGVYFYRLIANDFVATKKMMIVK